ncbi:MAG: hypothetical protein ACRD6W_06625 [Nitrososphaerales archaeon]
MIERLVLFGWIVALAVTCSACGAGAKNPSVAKLGTSTSDAAPAASTQTTSNSAHASWIAYNACMTDHGVPSSVGSNGTGSLLQGNSSPSQISAAAKACQRYLPESGIPKQLTEAQHGSATRPACAHTA